ncbi:MAG: phosphohydrolase, partial [Gaiellaceae bacterium]
LLVSAADKLYNARAILEDYCEIGPRIWDRFKRGREQQLWYFCELVKVYDEKCGTWRIVGELARTVVGLGRVSEEDLPRD